MAAGDIVTVDFHLDIPELYPRRFPFRPPSPTARCCGYKMCDWIDNAIALQMGHSDGQIYGYCTSPAAWK